MLRSAGLAAAALIAVGGIGLAEDSVLSTAESANFALLFSDACLSHRDSYEAIGSSAQANGWRPASGGADPRLGRLLDQTAALASRTDVPGWRLEHTAFQRGLGGQQYFLVTTFSSSSVSPPAVGCYVYNFGATAAIDGAVLSSTLSLGVAEESQEAGGRFRNWTLGDPEGHVMLGYLPVGSAASAQSGVSGVIMNVTTFLTP